MSPMTETIQETNPVSALGFCSATGAPLRLYRQATMTETMEHSRFDQRRLTEKLERFLLTRPEPPFLAVDLDVIQAKYRELCQSFPTASIYYAVKANPATEVVALLAAAGSSFDIASPSELDLCVKVGVHPARLSYGNTIKKAADIEYAFRRGVRRFAFDSEDLPSRAVFTARAHGDLDGDGEHSTFELRGEFTEKRARILPGLYVDREVE